MGIVNFNKKKSNRKRKKKGFLGGGNILLQIMFVLIAVFMFYNIGRSLYQTNHKLEILRRAEQEVKGLREDNIELVMGLDDVNKDEFIEAEVRNRLGYGRDGEVQMIISDELVKKTENKLYREESSKREMSYSRGEIVEMWVNFFLKGI